MERSARKVKAERDRRRLPKRGGTARWARRIAGLVATAAFLGVGAASLQMVLPDAGDETVIEPAPAATPAAQEKPKKAKKASKPKKPKGLTKKQKAARADAVAFVRSQGDTTLEPTDYDPKATLRVLIGRPVGDSAGGYRAYFFVKEQFIRNDAVGRSTRLRVSKTGKVTVMLSYGVYEAGDTPGRPSGRKRVRFKLEGGAIQALDTVPLASARFQRRR